MNHQFFTRKQEGSALENVKCVKITLVYHTVGMIYSFSPCKWFLTFLPALYFSGKIMKSSLKVIHVLFPCGVSEQWAWHNEPWPGPVR